MDLVYDDLATPKWRRRDNHQEFEIKLMEERANGPELLEDISHHEESNNH